MIGKLQGIAEAGWDFFRVFAWLDESSGLPGPSDAGKFMLNNADCMGHLSGKKKYILRNDKEKYP